tara:strand:+ start:243 stop:1022 length:780 start_codon:yes stop_codon:yes gene_type:complete
MAILSATGSSTFRGAFDNENNLNKFTAEMDVAITGLNKIVRYEMARAVISGWEGMVYNTPVRTGYAASEWQVIGEGSNPKARTSDKKRALRGWNSEYERMKGSPRGKPKFKYWPGGTVDRDNPWIISSEEVSSEAKQMGARSGPASYTELVGVGTDPAMGNLKRPSWVVNKGIEKIAKFMLSKDRRGRYKKIQNFQLVNTAVHIQRLENGFGSSTQGYIKKEFQRMMGMYNSAKPGKLTNAEKDARSKALDALAAMYSG